MNRYAILAWPFVAAKSGTLEALHLYLMANTATGVKGAVVGVYENLNYLNKWEEPGLRKFTGGRAPITNRNGNWATSKAPNARATWWKAKEFSFGRPRANEWKEFAGFKVKVKAGTKYWLAILVLAEANGQWMYYGKAKSGENAQYLWGNYSSENSTYTKLETILPPPAVRRD